MHPPNSVRLARRGTLLLLCLLCAWCTLALVSPPVDAATLSSSGQAGKKIDWTHPLRVLGEMRHSGTERDLVPWSVPFPLAGACQKAPAPDANFPSNCYNNYAYYVKVQGHYSWTSQYNSFQVTVWYMWCPRWAGDSVGINWAFGRSYVLSGCDTITFGNAVPDGANGSAIFSSNGLAANDGESPSSYFICNGSGWDDSLTVTCSGQFSVNMSTVFPVSGGADMVAAHSPCCYYRQRKETPPCQHELRGA